MTRKKMRDNIMIRVPWKHEKEISDLQGKYVQLAGETFLVLGMSLNIPSSSIP